MINAAAPVMTDDRVEPGRSLGGAALLGLVPPETTEATGVPAVLVADPVCDGVVSPSELDTFPRSELAKAHTSRMLLTSEGRFGVSRTAVWFVRSKLRTPHSEKR
jgi:hypothetical protein